VQSTQPHPSAGTWETFGSFHPTSTGKYLALDDFFATDASVLGILGNIGCLLSLKRQYGVPVKQQEIERDRVLRLLEPQLPQLSKLYRDSYLKKGRGALVLHTSMIESNFSIGEIEYNTRKKSLDLFDNVVSRTALRKLIDNYDPTTEGILILITGSTATWFVTAKLNPQKREKT